MKILFRVLLFVLNISMATIGQDQNLTNAEIQDFSNQRNQSYSITITENIALSKL